MENYSAQPPQPKTIALTHTHTHGKKAAQRARLTFWEASSERTKRGRPNVSARCVMCTTAECLFSYQPARSPFRFVSYRALNTFGGVVVVVSCAPVFRRVWRGACGNRHTNSRDERVSCVLLRYYYTVQEERTRFVGRVRVRTQFMRSSSLC